MFAKLSALVLALPLAVSALTIAPLTNAQAGGVVTITWTATTTDPSYFSIELKNPAFNDIYAIANEVQTSLGTITITLPQVLPGTDYNLVAIDPSNVNNVLSTSGTFSIGSATTTTTASSTTSSASSSTSTGTASTTSATATGTVSSVSAVSSGTVAGSSTSAASSTPSSFNSNGAAPFKMPGMVPAAGILLSAVAGAAMVF